MAGEIDRLVLVRLSGKRMAIDLASVAEVTELPETWQIPLAPEYFSGVMNSHGRLIPVIDLVAWHGSGTGSAQGKTLLLDRRIGDLALWVDDVERVIPSSDATLLRDGEELFAAVLEIYGEEVPLISAATLLDMIEADLKGQMCGGPLLPGKAA